MARVLFFCLSSLLLLHAKRGLVSKASMRNDRETPFPTQFKPKSNQQFTRRIAHQKIKICNRSINPPSAILQEVRINCTSMLSSTNYTVRDHPDPDFHILQSILVKQHSVTGPQKTQCTNLENDTHVVRSKHCQNRLLASNQRCAYQEWRHRFVENHFMAIQSVSQNTSPKMNQIYSL